MLTYRRELEVDNRHFIRRTVNALIEQLCQTMGMQGNVKRNGKLHLLDNGDVLTAADTFRMRMLQTTQVFCIIGTKTFEETKTSESSVVGQPQKQTEQCTVLCTPLIDGDLLQFVAPFDTKANELAEQILQRTYMRADTHTTPKDRSHYT